jgi:hypothetical protein
MRRTVTPMSERKWADLEPDPAMLASLDRADAGGSRADALTSSASTKNGWSNRLADACAVMVADKVRGHPTCRSLIVRPQIGGPAEPLTFVAGDRSKKVVVVVSSIVSGLQLGFSLKGMNFRDNVGMQFDKNLTALRIATDGPEVSGLLILRRIAWPPAQWRCARGGGQGAR